MKIKQNRKVQCIRILQNISRVFQGSPKYLPLPIAGLPFRSQAFKFQRER